MRPSRALALATVGFVLAPFATITLPFRQALVAQAGLALALITTLAFTGIARSGGWERIRAASRGRNLGVLLWASATVLGTFVGLLQGNQLTRVAGQTLSLGFLPLAYCACRLLPQEEESASPRRTFVVALVAATAAAGLVQLTVWIGAALLGGKTAIRLFLANSVGVSSLLPLVLVLAVAFCRAKPGDRPLHSTWLRRTVLTVLLLVLLGSAVRGAWLATGLAFLLYWTLTGTRPAKSAVLLAGAGSLAGVLLWIWAGTYLDRSRTNLLPSPERISAQFRGDLSLDDDGRLRWTSELGRAWVGKYFAAEAESLYRLRCRATGQGPEPAFVRISWRDEEGNHLGGLSLKLATAGGPYTAEAYGSPPEGTTRGLVLVGAEEPADGGGPWEITDLVVHRLGSARALPLVQQAAYLRDRTGSLLGRKGANPHLHRASVGFRIQESRSLLMTLRDASWARLLFGHGLGATFALNGVETHYIHNFYLFALYKLGILGSLLLLLAGGLWTLASLREAVSARRSPPAPRSFDSLFTGAAAAAWIAYWVWSVSSPEILNFRLAPIWGVLLALQAGTAVTSRRVAQR